MDEPFDEVLAEAAVLPELDAARAEVWVSGLLAEWADVDDLLARLAASPRDEALAIACALEPMVAAAGGIVARARAAGRALPAWAPHVGTAAAQQAWEIVDPFSGNVSIVVEYEHADGTRHSMLVEIEEGAAVDVHFGPAGLVDAAFDESDTRALSVRELAVDRALGRAAGALAVTEVLEHTGDADVTDELVMNRALALVRLAGVAPVASASREVTTAVPAVAPTRARPPRDADEAEADAAASATLRAALATSLAAPAPTDELTAAARLVREALAAGTDPDLDALAADVELADAGALDDEALLVRLAGAFVVPGALASFTPSVREALRGLEWADWLGAVIPLVRAGAGASAAPMQLVDNINRCAEVTTTVPRRDREAVAGVFAITLHAWQCTGAIDDEHRLRALGAWLLPRALLDAWRPSGVD